MKHHSHSAQTQAQLLSFQPSVEVPNERKLRGRIPTQSPEEKRLKKIVADRKYRQYHKAEFDRLKAMVSKFGGVENMEQMFNQMEAEQRRLRDMLHQKETEFERVEEMKRKFGGIEEMESKLLRLKQIESMFQVNGDGIVSEIERLKCMEIELQHLKSAQMESHMNQDSLVVCRLKKNSEFRLNHTSNRGPRNQQLSIMHDSSHATSDGGTDLTGVSEGDKTAEFYSKRATSSYDSHSIEQIDSALESEQKLSNDVGPTESSTPQKDSDDDDDYFADILKDDIIKLDEASLPARPDIGPSIASTSNPDRRPQKPRQENVVPHLPHFQGTANRRIKLRWPKGDNLCATVSKEEVSELAMEKLSSTKSEFSPNYLLSLFSRKTANLRLIYATFAILTLLALFLSSIGGSKPDKNFKYTTLYKNFWQ